MTFISYAQNFEDVMLWRALRHVDCGSYIDVGAFSPDEDSVTRAFYERGWSGINVEPNPKFLKELKERRAHDVNLEIAVSDKSGEASLHVIGDTGLTTLESDIAKAHLEKGWTETKVRIPTLTLEEIWSKYVAPGQEVHFLKIDVEGHELSVIAGLDWKRRRPWIVVVEATVPNGPDLTEGSGIWSRALEDAGYEMVYWDGLNKFFLASERTDLKASFSSPPNVYDDFITVQTLDALKRAETAEARRQEYAAKVLQSCHDINVAREDIRLCLDAVTGMRDEIRKTVGEHMDIATNFKLAMQDELRKSGGKQIEAINEFGTSMRGEMLRTAGEQMEAISALASETAQRSADNAAAWEDLRTAAREHEAALHSLAARIERPNALLRIITRLVRIFHVRGASRSQTGATYLSGRPLWERLLFRETGKPKGVLRRLLFHKSGKPRGIFRKRVLHPDGRPHSPFRKWMTSDQYRALPRAVRVSMVEPGATVSLSPNESRFFARLKAARKQGGQS